ncbi:MAG: DUF5519 family protein [Anaerolineae bacterium]|nr:DUF5519 family protein [Anaerolineae bacterium]
MFDSVAYIAASAAVWPLMSISPSRLGGLELTVGTREIGRLYDGGLLVVSVGRTLARLLITQGKAETHSPDPDSGWVSFSAYGKASVHHALWLLRLAYVRKLLGLQKSAPEMLARVDVFQELASLHLDREQVIALADR